MRTNFSLLLTLSALLAFTGCGSNTDSTSRTLVTTGETVTVQAGDIVKPAEEGTYVEVNDTAADGNSTLTVISGSVLLFPAR